jgi:DNA replication protein DnaC
MQAVVLDSGVVADRVPGTYISARACECANKARASAKATKAAAHLEKGKTWATWKPRRTKVWRVERSGARREVVYTALATWTPDRAGLGLLIYGERGSGKRHALAALAHKLIHTTKVASLHLSLRELLRGERDTYGKRGGTRPLTNALEAPVLLLDGLGLDQPTAWTIQALLDLAEIRRRHHRATVWATTLTPELLLSYLKRPAGVPAAERETVVRQGEAFYATVLGSSAVYQFEKGVR